MRRRQAWLTVAARSRTKEAGVDERVGFETVPAASDHRRGLRPRDGVRLPARHGRSGRRRAAGPQDAGAGRDMDDRRADGGDRVEDNLNPFERAYHGSRRSRARPSLSQDVGLGLGALAGESRDEPGSLIRRGQGLPKRLPKLTSSESTQQNSEHLAELKSPANNPDDLKSARCKAVYTDSIPVVASRSTCNRRVVVQATVVSPPSSPQTLPRQKAVDSANSAIARLSPVQPLARPSRFDVAPVEHAGQFALRRSRMVKR